MEVVQKHSAPTLFGSECDRLTLCAISSISHILPVINYGEL